MCLSLTGRHRRAHRCGNACLSIRWDTRTGKVPRTGPRLSTAGCRWLQRRRSGFNMFVLGELLAACYRHLVKPAALVTDGVLSDTYAPRIAGPSSPRDRNRCWASGTLLHSGTATNTWLRQTDRQTHRKQVSSEGLWDSVAGTMPGFLFWPFSSTNTSTEEMI